MIALLASPLYALAAAPAREPFFNAPIGLFLIAMLGLGGLAIWLAVTSKSGPEGSWEEAVRLSMAGRYAEAEQCCRKGLEANANLKPRHRRKLLICLGNRLIELDRYPEARQYLEAALPLGDEDGNCRASLGDVCLLQGSDPRKALEWAEQALQASTDGLKEITSAGWIGQHLASLIRGERWARRAWALALLGRQAESQESIDFALKLATPACEALKQRGNYRAPFATTGLKGLGDLYWRTGMALLAMGQTGTAREHFQIASESDPNGKCGDWCREQIKRLGVF